MQKNVLGRYSPFLLLAALPLLLLVLTTPPGGVDTVAGTAAGQQGLGVGATDGGASGDVATDGGATTGAGGATAPGGSAAQGGSAGQTAAASGASGGAGTQRLDALGRPVDGDRSRCAKDGRQEDISYQSPPCIPKLAGSNGGPTYQGVTAQSIKVVLVYQQFDEAVQSARVAAGTTMSQPQAEEAHDIIAEFINRHYELYGRRIDVVEHFAQMPDEATLRAEAKALNEKHRPFAVVWYVQPGMPSAFAEQLARLGVVALGANPLGDEFFLDHSPYIWTATAQGTRLADMIADYYCKRMSGKAASLAGDATLRVATRKLAVVSSEAPDALVVARRLLGKVTGGSCGNPQSASLYTYSADPATAEGQRQALVTRLKADGITTVSGGLFAGQEMDRQRYFPEHLLGELVDDDLVGRIFVALGSPTQMQNSTGIGFWTEGQPENDQEFVRVMQSVNPVYDPPYPARAPYEGLMFLARLMQFAGPNLTPANVLKGARTIPQIAGWTNANPWPGWKCCNPYAPMYHIGLDDRTFGAKADARQIYWDNSAVSKQDGVLGAYVSPDNGRRYAVGQWTPGEPRQP